MSTSELDWFKSSYSSAQGDSCVEVALTDQAVYVRDSKDVTRHHFAVNGGGWTQFMEFVARG